MERIHNYGMQDTSSVSYLLEPFKPDIIVGSTTTTPAPATAQAVVNISTTGHASGSSTTTPSVPSPQVDTPVYLTQDEWTLMSDQLVTQLYFHVDDIYKNQIASLTTTTLPALFALFDSQFISKDTMVILTKREELDKIQFKMDKTFPDQLVKFDTLFKHYIDAGGVMIDKEKIYLLIKLLPTNVKEKISDQISIRTDLDTYVKVREQVLLLFEKLSTWDILPSKASSSSSSSSKHNNDHADTVLYGNKEGGNKGGKKDKKGKGRGKKEDKKEDKKEHTHTNNDNKWGGGQGPTCFNCKKQGHLTMECDQPVTLEARKLLKEYHQRRKVEREGGGKGKGKGKPTTDWNLLALESPPPPLSNTLLTITPNFPSTPSLPFPPPPSSTLSSPTSTLPIFPKYTPPFDAALDDGSFDVRHTCAQNKSDIPVNSRERLPGTAPSLLITSAQREASSHATRVKGAPPTNQYPLSLSLSSPPHSCPCESGAQQRAGLTRCEW